MRQNLPNIAVFAVLAVALTGLWWYAERNWIPKQERPKPNDVVEADKAPAKPHPDAVAAAAGGALLAARELPPKPRDLPPPPAPPAPRVPPTLVALGGDDFYTSFLLSTRGGGVQQTVLRKFLEATRLGLKQEGPNGEAAPLYLIPGVSREHLLSLKSEAPVPEIGPGKALDPFAPDTPESKRLVAPSYVMFHYAQPDDKYPVPDLGEREWKVVEDRKDEGGTHTVAFETELREPYFLRIRKTFTLAPKEYHAGLRLDFERLPGGTADGPKFRYQIAGPHGLPIEGEWYTSTYRTALVGWTDARGTARRSYEDSATITNRRGGEIISRTETSRFKYAAIETQYFASAIAVDDQVEGAAQDPLAYVRATSELPITPHPDAVKRMEEAYKEEMKKPADDRDPLVLGRVQAYRDQLDRKTPHLDDITVRAVSEPFALAAGEKATHAFILYNGPAKVRLLKLLEPGREVDDALVDRYLNQYGLATLTDYQSPTPFGTFANWIYWTDLVVVMTNLMHWLLWKIHGAIGDWGMSIFVLTVFVKMLLFIPSRKQTAMTMKMVEVQKQLQPEIDKLKEKYGEDFHRFNQEKTRLMMQHGFNPFSQMGGCLLLFAQMPVFMGLYFCLQESIFFRLESFLWIPNLAAPDMLVWWSERIPGISDPANMGSLLYLGPYLNLLPLVAVALMLWQQTKMMPPATDPTMAQQQFMMKLMMGFMALMFYKVAAGLSLYFIASSVWGILERQIIPKPKLDELKPFAKSDAPPAKPTGVVGRFQERLRQRMEELQQQAEEQSARQIRNKPRGDDRGGRNKRRPK
jgi:YidC/Oxa1 family membrane protein insertase